MSIVLGIVTALVFGFVGAHFAGWAAGALLDGMKFTNPDDVALFTTVAEIGVTLAIMAVGAGLGVMLARPLKRRMIRKDII